MGFCLEVNPTFVIFHSDTKYYMLWSILLSFSLNLFS